MHFFQYIEQLVQQNITENGWNYWIETMKIEEMERVLSELDNLLVNINLR